MGISISTTSSSTITLAACLRLVGGGTCGGLVNTALIGAPRGASSSALTGLTAPACATQGVQAHAAISSARRACVHAAVKIFMLSLLASSDALRMHLMGEASAAV